MEGIAFDRVVFVTLVLHTVVQLSPDSSRQRAGWDGDAELAVNEHKGSLTPAQTAKDALIALVSNTKGLVHYIFESKQ